MHRPIGPALAEFARAVERIDDPHAAARQPDWVICGFLRKHRVLGPLGAQPFEDQRIGLAVAARAVCALLLDAQQ